MLQRVMTYPNNTYF